MHLCIEAVSILSQHYFTKSKQINITTKHTQTQKHEQYGIYTQAIKCHARPSVPFSKCDEAIPNIDWVHCQWFDIPCFLPFSGKFGHFCDDSGRKFVWYLQTNIFLQAHCLKNKQFFFLFWTIFFIFSLNGTLIYGTHFAMVRPCFIDFFSISKQKYLFNSVITVIVFPRKKW